MRRRAHEEMTPYGPTYFPTKAFLKVSKMEKKKKNNIRLRAADVCLLNPEIFSEAECELNEKINKLTNMESEGDSPSATSVTTQSAHKMRCTVRTAAWVVLPEF